MKKLFCVVLALILGFMAACSPADEPSESSALPQASDEVEVEEDLDLEIIHDQNIKQVVEAVNSSALGQIGYSIDSEAEKDSVLFFDFYITDSLRNKENNEDSDLVVRYQYQLDENDSLSLCTMYYNVDRDYLSDLMTDRDERDLNTILHDLWRNQDLIQYSSTWFSSELTEKIINLSEGNRLYVDKDTLDYFMADYDDQQ